MRNWRLWLAAGIISLLGGIFSLANPLAATLTATLLAAWAFIVVGILTIASAFADQGWGGRIAAILLGILMVLLGVNLAGDPLAGTLSLTMATAILLVVLGIVRISLGFSFRTPGVRFLLIMSGALSLLLAFMRDAKAAGIDLRVSALPGDMHKIAKVSGLLDILPLEASRV